VNNYISTYLKGIGIGIANIIPGVSGGTIALITGVFQGIIDSLKSFDITALKLLIGGRIKEFMRHTNFYFLAAVFGGAATGIFLSSLILGSLFENYPKYVWSFFFGLILASVYFVVKTVKKWNLSVIVSVSAGIVIAVIIVNFLNPASENASVFYLFLCGIVATCSMILPGLSGSFVLILMGNYELVMIHSVKNIDLRVLTPVMAGAAFGLLAFSHFLSYIFKKFPDHTIALLSGFIIGSLSLLWPWKTPVVKIFSGGKEKIIGYDWSLPSSFSFEELFSVTLIILGFAAVCILENNSGKNGSHLK
jgi:putative membrane protein